MSWVVAIPVAGTGNCSFIAFPFFIPPVPRHPGVLSGITPRRGASVNHGKLCISCE